MRLEDFRPPARAGGDVLVRARAVGICGTDHEIIDGEYGSAPAGSDRLVLGHEALGLVEDAPAGCGLSAGDAVVPMVRWPDPVPCRSCAAGEWDMCRNGLYTEHGIKERHGFAREAYGLPPERLVRVDAALGIAAVLLEPTSIVAKAWIHVDHIAARSSARPQSALVTGAGPVGLLAALLAAQRGLEVHVFDRVTDGLKPDLVRELGAEYHSGGLDDLDVEPDVVIECTGAAPVILDAVRRTGHNGIVCLAGISSGGHTIGVDVGALDREMVLENDVVFGSVNANRSHYDDAARALARADRSWLERLITRRVPLSRWEDAYRREEGDVKTIVEFDD